MFHPEIVLIHVTHAFSSLLVRRYRKGGVTQRDVAPVPPDVGVANLVRRI